jgi:hypothetical protein
MLAAAKDVLISVRSITKSIRRRPKKRKCLRNGDIRVKQEAVFHANITATLQLHPIQAYPKRNSHG